jgi:hypothetical protein
MMKSRFIAFLGLSLLLVGLIPTIAWGLGRSDSAENAIYLPNVITCGFPATTAPESPEALIRITPYSGINASTFNKNSIRINNYSDKPIRIQEVRIDLSSALLPDIVFDPNGGAGDNVAKDVQVNTDSGTGFNGHTYEQPHDGGYDVLILNFGEFDAEEEFAFSVDVDPTSIKGSSAPGPNESGSVSGLEMAGARVSVTFETPGGIETFTTSLHTLDGDDSDGTAVVRNSLPGAPTLEVLGIDTPTTTSNSTALVRITGTRGATFRLWTMEAGLFVEGLPGGGFDIQPYEANSVIAIRRAPDQQNCFGSATFEVPLSKSLPAAGLNHLIAYQIDQSGLISPASNVEILEFAP